MMMIRAALGAALLAASAECLVPALSSLQAAAAPKVIPRTPSIPFIVDSEFDVAGLGEELAIVERAADYEEFFSMRRTSESEPFLVAGGSAEDWCDLCRTFSDVEVFDPHVQGPDECSGQEHYAVAHFAACTEKAKIEELAAARDYVASRTCGRSVVACALVSQPEDCIDPMPTPLKDLAREYGVVVLFGRTLGAVVSLAQVEADLAQVEADLTISEANATTLATDLVAANRKVDAKDAALTKLLDAAEDPATRAELRRALNAGIITNDAD